MDKIAVLIPCYNESKTIEKVVKDFKSVLPEAVIYVYDNNSSDNTAEKAEKAGAVVRHEYMQGKGNVIRRMFRENTPGKWLTKLYLKRRIWLWGTDYLQPTSLKTKDRFIILETLW